MIITFDGPVASGKSSVAQFLAKKLGFYYINTGFLYRAVTYCLLQFHGYNRERLTHVDTQDLRSCIDRKRLVYTYTSETGPQVTYDNQDITRLLKDAEIDHCVSLISPQQEVRHALSQLQQQLAYERNVVCDGRDVGSVVFPKADYKFYLTASLVVRAARWQKDQKVRGKIFTQEQAQASVNERDLQDSSRAHSPLVVPEHAIVIDSSNSSVEETVAHCLSFIRDKSKNYV